MVWAASAAADGAKNWDARIHCMGDVGYWFSMELWLMSYMARLTLEV